MSTSPIQPGTAPPLPTGSDDREELREASRAFEGLFLKMMIKEMREAQLEDGFFGTGSGSDIYEGMLTDHLGDSLSQDSPLGIADALYERWTGESEPLQQARRALSRATEGHAAAVYAAADGPSRAPGTGVSRSFGWGQDPISGESRFHGGVDLPARTGAPVLAIAPGRVISVENKGGYGLQVTLEHASGWTTRYAHLSAAGVREGQWVGRGQELGQVGSSGRSTGPHLHFEAARDGQKVDPGLAAPGPIRPQVLAGETDE